MNAGLILEHGRLQPLDERGAVIGDASLERVQPEWKPALDIVLDEWLNLQSVQGLSLTSVYLRGSIPRGLALDGISDVDTIGIATVDPMKTAPALATWRAQSSRRTARVRQACPQCSGLEMNLIAIPARSRLGQWLGSGTGASSSESSATRRRLHWTLTDERLLREVDAFRLASQAVLLHGVDLVAHLPPPVPQPRLALALRDDIRRASRTVRRGALADSAAIDVARWAAKRTLRSGMELAAAEYGGFSRDLLPCHRAISSVLGEPAGARSLRVLQLACMPEDATAARGGERAVARELLHATTRLAEVVEAAHLADHFTQPLVSFEQLPAVPPLPPEVIAQNGAPAGGGMPEQQQRASSFPSSSGGAATQPTALGAKVRAAAVEAAERLARRALVTGVTGGNLAPRLPWAGPPGRLAASEEEAARLISDDLPPLTLDLQKPPRHVRVLDLPWSAAREDGAGGAAGAGTARTTPASHKARVERIARWALARGRRPVVLRGMASELAPIGAQVWRLETLPLLAPSGSVRISPDATFRFVRETHPLCRSGAFPRPSRVCRDMSGDEFVARIAPAAAESPSAPPPPRPLYYGGGERYYMQADVRRDVLRADRVPALWRALFGAAAQAQPLRLWVSTHGATTPLHFDAAHSFLAQMRGTKRLTFFPPDALPGLYAYPTDHPLHRRARVDLYAPPDERDEDFPLFAPVAAPRAQAIELGEGDVILFPKHWWHHVETTSHLSVSVGCRYAG